MIPTIGWVGEGGAAQATSSTKDKRCSAASVSGGATHPRTPLPHAIDPPPPPPPFPLCEVSRLWHTRSWVHPPLWRDARSMVQWLRHARLKVTPPRALIVGVTLQARRQYRSPLFYPRKIEMKKKNQEEKENIKIYTVIKYALRNKNNKNTLRCTHPLSVRRHRKYTSHENDLAVVQSHCHILTNKIWQYTYSVFTATSPTKKASCAVRTKNVRWPTCRWKISVPFCVRTMHVRMSLVPLRLLENKNNMSSFIYICCCQCRVNRR